MKVAQFPYLSTEAIALRRRDGIPPWGVHPCEVDALGDPDQCDPGPFRDALEAAIALRAEIEAAD
jgi:hypothetical protein